MLNVYEYHTNPEVLDDADVPPDFRFEYEMAYDAIEYISNRISDDEVSEDFEAIAKVFETQFRKCDAVVSTYGDKCSIYPIGRDKMNQLAVHLNCYDNSVNGYIVRYTEHIDFCTNVTPPPSNRPQPKFARNLIIAGLKALALAEIND